MASSLLSQSIYCSFYLGVAEGGGGVTILEWSFHEGKKHHSTFTKVISFMGYNWLW